MTQEEKQLLLKDLCARLPYGVQCDVAGRFGIYTFVGDDVKYLIYGRVFKPYLRSMSSMTEEEKQEYDHRLECMFYDTMYDDAFATDWLNEHHFDYRGLIEKNLAIEVTKVNNPYKE